MRPLTPRWARIGYRWISRWVHRIFPNENALLLALAFLVGVGSGFGALLFEKMIAWFQDVSRDLAGAIPFLQGWPALGTLVVLVVAGLLGGILLRTLLRSGAGHGVPDVMAAVALRGGRIRPRVVGDTAITSGLCIGAGGSAGPEGPIVQIGSGIGSVIGQSMRMSSDRLRILTACGAAGGISAIFGAPLAGVMFAVEVILGDFGVKSLTAIVISSVLAASTFQAFVSWEPRFHVPEHGVLPMSNLPLILALGVMAALVSWFFIKSLYWTEDRFARLPVPAWVKPAVGMGLLGVVALGFPGVLGDGYHGINDALNGRLDLQLMAVLVLAKLVATCLTVGSGNVGGLFAPSMVLGAMMGGAFGIAAELMWPQQTGSVALYALVGMASMIAGTTHATISSILLIFEVTNDYAMILPVMLASATAVVLSSALNRQSIYTLKLIREGIHLQRGVEVNVMGSIPVRQVMRPPDQVVNENTHFNTLIDTIENSRSNTFPVVDDEGILHGVITYGDIRALLHEERSPEMDLLIVARDIATPRPEVVTPEENLNDAMRTFGMQDMAVLPVVDTRESMRLVGKLHRIDVLNAYRRALMTSG